MRDLIRVGLVVIAAAASAVALAQVATPAKSAADAQAAIEARQQIFKDIKKANEPLGAMLRGQREFDAAVVTAGATQIQALSVKIPDAFTVDTHQFKDTKTNALDGIWSALSDFKAKADALNTAAANVIEVAKGGDKAAMRQAVIDMSKKCGSCHDSFKAKT